MNNDPTAAGEDCILASLERPSNYRLYYKALNELKTAWELMKECYQMDGEPIPKAPSRNVYEEPLNVPVDAQLYHTLTDEAAKIGMSLYTLVTQKLSKTTALQTDNITQVATNKF